jgi:hypothetical protein
MVETRSMTTAQRARVLELAARRFPEVAVERCFATLGDGARDVWVCRAASETHLRRWAEAARLELVTVERIASEILSQLAEPVEGVKVSETKRITLDAVSKAEPADRR